MVPIQDDGASPQPMMRKTALILLIAGGLLSVGLQLWFKPAGRREVPEALKNIVLPQPRPLQPFTLTDHHGKPFTLERLRGAWTFLFFGYTHCPDICPVAMGLLAEVDRALRASGNRVPTRTVFVSVDPRRDDLELLARYVPYFNPEFLGVTGVEGEVEAFSRQLGAFYMIPKDADPTSNYTVNHTGSIFLIDPEARFSAIFSHQYQDGRKIADLFGNIATLQE